MYLNDKNTRVTLRLNSEQFDFIKSSADTIGVSPSEFLRMVVNMTMISAKRAENVAKSQVGELVKTLKENEVQRRENEQTDSDDFV